MGFQSAALRIAESMERLERLSRIGEVATAAESLNQSVFAHFGPPMKLTNQAHAALEPIRKLAVQLQLPVAQFQT